MWICFVTTSSLYCSLPCCQWSVKSIFLQKCYLQVLCFKLIRILYAHSWLCLSYRNLMQLLQVVFFFLQYSIRLTVILYKVLSLHELLQCPYANLHKSRCVTRFFFFFFPCIEPSNLLHMDRHYVMKLLLLSFLFLWSRYSCNVSK